MIYWFMVDLSYVATDEELAKIDKFIKEGLYSSREEFMLDAIKSKLESK